MSMDQVYLIDSDVFITAKNLHYPFDICLGFWKSLLHQHQAGHVYSIDRVRNELLAGPKTEKLVQWVRKQVPKSFFHPVGNSDVEDTYSSIIEWVHNEARVFEYAKHKFAKGADGWLVAYAKVHGMTVVTNEQCAPESRRSIKLPDLCAQFEVQCEPVFAMLRALNIQFDLV